MTTTDTEPLRTKGLVLHSEARYYDLLAWLLTLGRERALRERLADLAALRPGERVLDVGCGTGTLAIAVKRHVGPAGTVVGIDASPHMLERAKRKAVKAGAEVRFQTAVVEALPFPDASFDVVFSTLMLHHLPRPVREQCAREIRRVLVPGGRVVAVDFAPPAREQKRGLLARFHRHGHVALRDIAQLLNDAELRVREMGAVGLADLQFVLATAPLPGDIERPPPSTPATRSRDPLPAPRWPLVGLLVVALLVAHGILIGGISSRLTLPVVVIASWAAIVVVMHTAGMGAHTLLRRRKGRHTPS
jgi:ubiquinone/menaquinone biosynthesis C-methylase UbiE